MLNVIDHDPSWRVPQNGASGIKVTVYRTTMTVSIRPELDALPQSRLRASRNRTTSEAVSKALWLLEH